MDSDAPQPNRREKIVSALDVAIEALNIAKEMSSITPAKAVFGSVSVVLTMIKVGSPSALTLAWLVGWMLMGRAQDTMINDTEYVELGLVCADVCTALDRGLNGKRLDELSGSVCEAINQMTR